MSLGRRRQRGIALLMVLWILMILGILALDFSRYMRDDAMAAINFADETRGYYVALAGMNRAIYDAERMREQDAGRAATDPTDTSPNDLDDEDEPVVPPDGEWHEGVFAGARWRVRMSDEAALIPINRVTETLLTRIITNLTTGGNQTTGVDRRSANQVSTVVDSIIDWRDHDSLVYGGHGAESDFYLKRRPPYRAKNGFFDSPEELLLVRGVTPALYYGSEETPGLKDIFSVYSRSSRINVGAAPPPVLQALFGNETAADLIEQRTSGLPIQDLVKAQLVAIDPGLSDLIDSAPPRLVRLEAFADVSHARNQSHVAAVTDLAGETGDQARIVRWLDRAPWEGRLPQPAGAGAEDEG